MFKGKKLKQSDKPKTFVPGEQLDKLTFNYSGNTGFNQQEHVQIRTEKVQPSKEDIEAIRVINTTRSFFAMYKTNFDPFIKVGNFSSKVN